MAQKRGEAASVFTKLHPNAFAIIRVASNPWSLAYLGGNRLTFFSVVSSELSLSKEGEFLRGKYLIGTSLSD